MSKSNLHSGDATGLNMIAVAEAKRMILHNSLPLPPVKLPLLSSAGLTLAENIISPIDIPNYVQSSMDGYAFSYKDLTIHETLEITGEIAAGSRERSELSPGTATRIFTGAAVPPGADTVVMQEKTRIENGKLFIQDLALQPGSNIRAKGAEIRSGQLALEKNTILKPAAIGFLASIGITDVMAYPLPSVSIIVTGNELQTPGQTLQYGQVYESNSWSLQAALQQMHLQQTSVYRANDDLETLVRTLQKALSGSDIVCLTGGVSVGDYDFVAAAAGQTGIEKIFHKIKQKPGKPFYFGRKGKKLVFGLPGNPASVLSCFYQYVEPALKKVAKQNSALRIIEAPISTTFKKAAGLTHFLKGYYDGSSVTPLSAQESFRLSSFAGANCLIRVNEEVTICEAGEVVEVHLLP